MIYKGHIFTPEGTFKPGKVIVENEIITDINYSDEYSNDTYIIPGLVDIHTHGCMGHDICEASENAIDQISDYLLANGVVAFFGATMTLPVNQLMDICEKLGNMKNNCLQGIYLEGPFIAASKAGAQSRESITKPDTDLFLKLYEASNKKIRFALVAPETENADNMITTIINQKVVCSLGHTNSSYDTYQHAFSLGASEVTHLYNAMPSLDKREPGLIGAAFDSDAYVELICDGYHVHPSVIRMTFNTFSEDRIILISDSMMATGMPDGQYSLGGQPVYVNEKKASTTDGSLAGSATNLYDCMINAVKFGVPVAKAVKAATINPARQAGIDNLYGTIEKGKCGLLTTLPSSLF